MVDVQDTNEGTPDNLRVVGPDLAPDLFRVDGEREDVGAGGVEVLGDGGELLAQGLDDAVERACTASASGWS